MISVVCWKWSTPGYRSTFRAEAVNVLRRMVARHYLEPHRFICVTNEPRGLDPEVEVVADRADFADLTSPAGPSFPSCYRRLRLFAPDARATFGERVVSLDLDCVIVAGLHRLWHRPEPVVGWQDPIYPAQLCGSMLLLTTGAAPFVWSEFDPRHSPANARTAGFRGSDQAWISYVLGNQAGRWTAADGVLSWRRDLREGTTPLPKTARVVFLHCRTDPWSLEARRVRWLREAYA